MGDLNNRETYWIVALESFNPKIGYNAQAQANGGYERTLKIKEKISNNKKGKSWGSHTVETKRLMRQRALGRKFTDKHKKNLSIKRRLRTIEQKTIEKMRESMLRKNRNYAPFILTYQSIDYFTNDLTEFCEQHNLSKPNLYKILAKERKHHKGWSIRRDDTEYTRLGLI